MLDRADTARRQKRKITLRNREASADIIAGTLERGFHKKRSIGEPEMASKNQKKADQLVGISVAAEITGIEIYTLRYWEKEFPEYLQPVRTSGGQRRYRPLDIQTVFLLKRLLREEMFSIAGAKRALKEHFSREAA